MIRPLAALALTLFAAAPAAASCDAANLYSFAFASQPAATLSYAASYGYTAISGAGATRGFTMSFATYGVSSSVVASTQLPAIGTLITGPDATKRDLVIGAIFAGRTPDIAGTSNLIAVTFTFTQPIRDLALTVHDIDFAANQYRDLMMVTGSNGASTYTPVLTTPYGNGNATTAPRTAALSSVTMGPGAAPFTLAASQATGNGASGNNSDTGTVNISFSQPVTSVTIRYGNYPLTAGETATGQQAAGIAGLSFCPLPVVSVQKSSAPVAGTLGAYNLPANDVEYTLTVTNSGGSPVDAGSIVLGDVLPANVTFRNLDFDATVTGPFKAIAGTSGLALNTGDSAFSNDGGTSYAYTPASGYDAQVRAIRLIPTGTMAAGSSFAVKFRAMIR